MCVCVAKKQTIKAISKSGLQPRCSLIKLSALTSGRKEKSKVRESFAHQKVSMCDTVTLLNF